MPLNQPKSLARTFADAKQDYAGMTESRFRRNRPGATVIGVSGDWHSWVEGKFVQMREYARAMVRDDACAKFLIGRAVDNIIGGGFTYEPETGDEKLDLDLWARQDAWAKDPQACDVTGERTFPEMERQTAFSEYVDGDVFVAGTEGGQLQVFEADRCATPRKSTKNIVHGIELDDQRRHVNYYFRREQPGLRYDRLYDFHQLPAYDDQGYKQVWHVSDPFRFTQTRGVTVFHPVFDKAGMYEDIDFALLVKQQFAAMVAWFLKRTEDYAGDVKMGARRDEQQSDGTTQTIEEVAPGSFIRGNKGEDLEMKASPIPSAETMAHLRSTLQIISLNIGLPLFVATMDPSEGSFSAWRGALDQAKIGFTRNQERYDGRLHRNVIRFNIRRWMAEDPALRSAAKRSGVDLFGHTWHKPRWRYVQPVHDATADTMRVENYLADHYTVCAEQGLDADDVRDKTIKYNKSCVVAAILAAEEVKKETGVEVHWRDVYNRAMPKGAQAIDTIEDQNTLGGSKPAGGSKGN